MTFVVAMEGKNAAIGTCTEAELARSLDIYTSELCRKLSGSGTFEILDPPGVRSKKVLWDRLRIEGTIRCEANSDRIEPDGRCDPENDACFASAIERPPDRSPSKHASDACVAWRRQLHAAKTPEAKMAVVERRPDGC